jgi:hypothetical protein
MTQQKKKQKQIIGNQRIDITENGKLNLLAFWS